MKWKVKLPDQPICALYSDRALYIRDDKSGIWKRNKSDWFHLDHTAKYVIVGQSLLGFCSGGIVHPYQFDNLHGSQNNGRNRLPTLDEHIQHFAVTTIRNRYVLLSGGALENSQARAEVFMYDKVYKKWLPKTSQPSLNIARYCHSSCASSKASFVVGGLDGNRSSGYKREVEMLYHDN